MWKTTAAANCDSEPLPANGKARSEGHLIAPTHEIGMCESSIVHLINQSCFRAMCYPTLPCIELTGLLRLKEYLRATDQYPAR